MAVVLLAWELGGGAGHCVDLARIAKGLAGNGHQVSVALHDLVAAQPFFADLPVAYFQAPFLVGSPSQPILWPRTMAQILQNTGFGNGAQLDVLVQAWRSILSAVRPEVVVFDHSPTALLASRWYDHRRFIIARGFELPPRQVPLPELEYWRTDRSDPNELEAKEQAILDRVNSLLVRDGLAPLNCLADLYAAVDDRCLLTFAELDHYPQRTPAEYFGAWSPGGGCVPEWPAVDGPRLFGYLKPPRPRWELSGFLSFVRAQPIATLLYVPGADADWCRRLESPSLRFVHEPVDIGQLAPQCDAAVLNGNAGSVTEILLHGVPLLNIPLHLEQLVMAHRVVDLGAGLMADARQPQVMAEQLMKLLSTPSYRESAAAFARKYADFDPDLAVAQAVSRITALL
jgi:hypothetical protein